MTYIPLLPFGLRGADNPGFDTVLGHLFRDGDPAPDGAPSFTSMAGAFKPKTTNPNPFLRAYQEDFAGRAQWCAHEPAACNHAPVITDVSADVETAPGGTVRVSAKASDPDGDELCARWSLFAPDGTVIWEEKGLEASFVVPADAVAGDRYVLTLTVKDVAERPMTRYAQVAVTVA